MAYGLGHVGPHYFAALEAVREIRNAFAHFRRPLTLKIKRFEICIETKFTLPYILPDPS